MEVNKERSVCETSHQKILLFGYNTFYEKIDLKQQNLERKIRLQDQDFLYLVIFYCIEQLVKL